MATKPAKLASKNKPAATKIVKQCRITETDGVFTASDINTGRRITLGATFERCRKLAGFRHGYEVV